MKIEDYIILIFLGYCTIMSVSYLYIKSFMSIIVLVLFIIMLNDIVKTN
jgi:hypothetical protein